MLKKSVFGYFIFSIIVSFIVLFYYANKELQDAKHLRYSTIANNNQLKIKTLIEQKKEATLLLALSLAKDSNVKKSLRENNPSLLSLREITDTYTEHTSYKNVWIHLITKDGISLLKSWTDRKGESILDIRKDIVSFLKKPEITSVISVGKYDMTIKSMVPIYDNGELLGLFEVITKVNSIANYLSTDKFNCVVLVDKKYKTQLRHPFTQTFIQDYYVANLDVNPKVLNFTKTQKVEQLLQKKDDYLLIDNYFLNIYHLQDVHSKEMGYFLIFKDLSDIDMSDIESKYLNFILLWIVVITVAITLLFFLLNKNYTQDLKEEIDIKTKELHDINKNLQIIVNEEIEKNRKNDMKILQQEKLLNIATMFRNIGHHWRQPLSAITSELSALSLKIEYGIVTNEEMNETITNVMKRAQELSDNIEFFSNSYSIDEQLALVSIKDILDDATLVVSPFLREHKIELIKLYGGSDLEILFYKNRLINMVVSILQNAYESLLKSDKSEKFIKLSFQKEAKYSYIIIEDNGIGIDEEFGDKIFQPYVTTKHKAKGVGLSLYVASTIVTEDLSGTIEAKNTNDGVKVIIQIPNEKREVDIEA